MKPQLTKITTLILLLSLLLIAFASSGSVLAQQSQFAAPKLVADTSFLNVRTGPGIQYSILITVVGGTELPVLGVAQDKVWYQVSTIAGVGWVNIEYTLARGDFSVVPLAEPPESTVLVIQNPSTVPVIQSQAVVTGTYAVPAGQNDYLWGVSILGGDFHAQPDYASQKIRAGMGKDLTAIYPIQGVAAQFIQYTIPGLGTGWTDSQFLAFRPLVCSSNQGATVIIKEASVSGVGYMVKAGTEAFVIGAGGGLAKIRLADGSIGWIGIDYTQGRDESKIHNFCPNTVASSVAGTTVTTGTVPVTGGVVGSTTAAGLAAPRVVINTGFLNVRSGPGAQFTIVATVPGGTELPVIGMAEDGVWYWVQGTFGRGWLNNEFVLFRGSIENVPIIHDAVGMLAAPVAVVEIPVTLYAAPNISLGVVGAITGPAEFPIVARTTDGTWVQLNTSIGFGWVQASQVTLRGDVGLIPVVG